MTEKALERWTVDDVSEWLDTIGLGHKAQPFRDERMDGKALKKATPEDLKEMGLSGLQAKKILREMEEIKSHSVEGVSMKLTAENDSLKSQVNDLTKLLTTLQSDVAKLKSGTFSTPSADPSPAVTQHSVTLPFCSGTEISGNQTQVLTITLGPGQTVRAEPGAMLYMSDWIEMNTRTGGQGFQRWLTGQKIFLTEFTYHGPAGTADKIAFSPDMPGQIVPVRLEAYGGKIICQKGSLLASAHTVDLSVEFTDSLATGFFGGEGFMLQGVNGSGYAFLEARGVLIKKELRSGERLKVSTGCLVGFQHTVRYSITSIGGGAGNVLFGGQGLFVAALTGPGTIWLESQPTDRLIAKVADALNKHDR